MLGTVLISRDKVVTKWTSPLLKFTSRLSGTSIKTKIILMYQFSITAVTNYHTLRGLKNTNLLSLTFVGQRPSLRLSQKGLHFFLEALGKDPFPRSFKLLAECSPGGRRTEVPFPCRLLSEGHSQLLEAACIIWLVDPFLYLPSQQTWVKSLSHRESLALLVLLSHSARKGTPLLRAHGIRLCTLKSSQIKFLSQDLYL